MKFIGDKEMPRYYWMASRAHTMAWSTAFLVACIGIAIFEAL